MATKKTSRPHNFRALSKPKELRKKDHQHYWPYIPVLLLVVATFLVSLFHPVQKRGVLAYATNMSSSGLLEATNQRRIANGVNSLTINSKLTAAAQAKANDMVARNYWSHNTPEGDEPWVFVKNAGYAYLRAGENLAYGFDSSNETVIGWMNSPTHKANLLDAAFTEVGFGYANSSNYHKGGEQTVVVAMYGRPQVLAATETNTQPTAAVQAKPTATPAAATPQTPAQPIPTNETKTLTTESTAIPEATQPSTVYASTPQPVSRIASYLNGNATWATFAIGLVTGLAITAILIRHAAGIRHLIRDGEKFIMHHPVLDTALVSLVLIGAFLSQTTGFVL